MAVIDERAGQVQQRLRVGEFAAQNVPAQHIPYLGVDQVWCVAYLGGESPSQVHRLRGPSEDGDNHRGGVDHEGHRVAR